LHYRSWPIVFASVELLSGVICALYIPGHNGFLIQAQIVFQLSFAAVIYFALNSLLPGIDARD